MALATPNVEVNRRAEGTSELNRRLGAVEKGAATLERCGVAGDYGRGLAGKQARCAYSVPRRQSSRPATARCACAFPRRPSSRPATVKRRRSTWRWNGKSQSEA